MRNKAKVQTLDCTRSSLGIEGLWIHSIFSIMERNVPSSFQTNQQNLHVSRKVKHLKVCALRRCTAMGATSAISYVHLGSFVHATARRSSQDTNVIQWCGWWLKPKTIGVPQKKSRCELQTRNEMISITVNELSVFWTSVGNDNPDWRTQKLATNGFPIRSSSTQYEFDYHVHPRWVLNQNQHADLVATRMW
jgi:hypothetical protein